MSVAILRPRAVSRLIRRSEGGGGGGGDGVAAERPPAAEVLGRAVEEGMRGGGVVT